MLFKKQICNNCKGEFDSTKRTCPYCGEINPEKPLKKIGNGNLDFSLLSQILLVVIGVFAPLVFSLLSLPIASLFFDNEDSMLVFVDYSAEIATFLAISSILFIGLNYKLVFKQFSKWRFLLFGLIFGGVIIGFGFLMDFIFISNEYYASNLNQTNLETIIYQNPVLAIIIFGIVGPFIEELTYRAGLFSLINRKNRILAYVVTTLVFAFAHFSIDPFLEGNAAAITTELLNIPSYVIPAFLLTFTYDNFGFSGSYIAHSLNNIFAVIYAIVQK